MTSAHTLERPIRLGAVSFLNTRPLIEGLDADPRVEVFYDVPARLPERLTASRVDAALVPVVDLLRSPVTWRIVSDACIAAEGETLTVRVFSRVPPDRIETLSVDGDSHTSVALARLLWAEVHRRPLAITPLSGLEELSACQAVLLIGDKVVAADTSTFEYDIDLGGAWRAWTGLPFVFAVWATPAATARPELEAILNEARDRGAARAAAIAERDAPALGWPIPAAIEYLTRKLSFTLTPRARRGMDRFLHTVARHDIVPGRAEALTGVK